MKNKLLKSMLGVFCGLMVTGGIVSADELEDFYILLLPKVDGVEYTVDEAHLSTDYSTDEYEVLLYNAGEQLSVSLSQYEDITFKDAVDRNDFSDYTLNGDTVTMVMPERDLEMLVTVGEQAESSPESPKLCGVITAPDQQNFSLESINFGLDSSGYTVEVYDSGNFDSTKKGAYAVIFKVTDNASGKAYYWRYVICIPSDMEGQGDAYAAAAEAEVSDPAESVFETEAVESAPTEEVTAEAASTSESAQRTSTGDLFAVKLSVEGLEAEIHTLCTDETKTISYGSDFATTDGVTYIKLKDTASASIDIYRDGSLDESGELIVEKTMEGSDLMIDIVDWMTQNGSDYILIVKSAEPAAEGASTQENSDGSSDTYVPSPQEANIFVPAPDMESAAEDTQESVNDASVSESAAEQTVTAGPGEVLLVMSNPNAYAEISYSDGTSQMVSNQDFIIPADRLVAEIVIKSNSGSAPHVNAYKNGSFLSENDNWLFFAGDRGKDYYIDSANNKYRGEDTYRFIVE